MTPTPGRLSRWAPRTTALVLAALAASGCRLTDPMGPDRAEFRHFAPPARPGTDVSMLPLRMAHQDAPRCAPAGAASCREGITMVYAAYLARHPRGTFLIDAGLSTHTADELASFPWFERLAFGYVAEDTLGGWLPRLEHAGWPRPSFVVVTHAHWDHLGGLTDLVHPRVLMGPGEEAFVRSYPASRAPVVMARHLDGAAVETVSWDGPAYENFPASHDVFGDGSVVLVPLPGHTPGSLGVFVTSVRGHRVLFAGDAAWTTDAIRLPSHKLAPLGALTDADRARLSDSLWRLHHLAEHDPALVIVPGHDGDAVERLRALATTPR